jgi:hypothetical protein
MYVTMTPQPRRPAEKGKPNMVKTTLELPEDLWQRAKIRALEEHRDLRDLLIEGLALVLKRAKGGK